MTFRTRLTLFTALAATLALVGASAFIYSSYRHDLIRQVDRELGASLGVAPLNQILTVGPTGPRVVVTRDISSGRTFRIVLPRSPAVLEVHRVPISPAPNDVSEPARYRSVNLHGVPSRQLTIFGANSTVSVTRSLADIDRSLSHLRWLLAFTCLGGVGVATLLGALVSGRAIAPLRRLTEATERIAGTGDLSARTGQNGRDEISRLSTQLDALLATLEGSIKTQRQFVADASHELRTPLATLRANVGLLAHPDGLPADERAELVADVEDELESMTALVGELVELAHGDELDDEPTHFRLDQVVRSAVDRAAQRGAGRTQAVAFRTELEPTTVIGVPERVARAVDNLLDNARKWSPPGETVDVAVRNGVVEVRDRGPGIAPEDAPLVFNRFYRSIKARGTPGAGLGLAIVKQVADAHDGTISIDRAPDGGAILRLTLLPTR